jgi:hypothetical protein
MWFLAVTAWVVVVIAGSALTWVAIDRAGNQVTGNPTQDQTQPAVVGTLGAAPTRSPKHGPRATRTSPTGPRATTLPSRTPSAAATSTHPGGSPSKTTASSPVQTETRTWSGAAGTVTVSCTGRTARLQGTSPGDGWHVEVGDSSGGEIEVTFKRNESEVQVKATCVGGVPRFQVESGSYDGSDSSSFDSSSIDGEH